MKKILITGANGQLGRCLRDVLRCRDDVELTATDIVSSAEDEVVALDLTDAESVGRMFEHGFDYVVNCAAYTAVDKAEDESDLCHRINADALRNIGEAAFRSGSRVIHISTDYVFSGDGCRPYQCDDPVDPRSVYGKTKLEGEWELIYSMDHEDFVIIRTAWLYSQYGNNFVKTMLRLGDERENLKVVVDQIGSPTYAHDLAVAIVKIVDSHEFVPGIFHYTDEGVASWFDFAVAIMDLGGIRDCVVTPCATEDYPTNARRPFYSVLSKQKIRDVYGVRTPYWRDSLKKCINILTDNGFTD